MQKALFIRQVRFTVALATSAPIGLLSSLVLTGTAIAPLTAQADTLSRWQYDPTTQQLEVIVPAGTTPRYFLAAEPARIVLDLPGTEVGAVQMQQAYSGAVQQIRVAQFQPGLARIVMQFAPETKLDPQQAELKRVGTVTVDGQTGDRWVLRPLLATSGQATASTPADSATAQASAISTPETADSATADSATGQAPTISPPETTDSTTANLPPLEPGATPIPVELPPADSTPAPTTAAEAPESSMVSVPDSTAAAPEVAPAETASSQVEPSSEPASSPANPVANPPVPPVPPVSSSTSPLSAEPERVASSNAGTPPAPQPSRSPQSLPPRSLPPQENLAMALPPASPEPGSAEDAPAVPGTVTVPEPQAVTSTADATAATAPSPTPNPAPDLPPATAAANPSNSMVTVPSLDSATQLPPSEEPSEEPLPSVAPVPNRTVAAAPASIEFGEPLPTTTSETANPTNATPANTRDTTVAVRSTSPEVLLPSGTVLSLRYPGDSELKLSSDYPYQEVLVVDRAVRGQSGEVLIPEGSPVIGRFETGSSGSEFIAQAIEIEGQTFLLNAKSDRLSGDRQVSRNHLLQNSALGAVAGTLLGAFTGVGLIAGIAAGAATSAATTYITSPQPAIIQPDQIVEVRLIEDLRQPNVNSGIGG